MKLAVKCAPEKRILDDAQRAGFKEIEVYLSKQALGDLSSLTRLLKGFPFRYAVHACVDGSLIKELANLAKEVSAEVVVFHNTYWEDEWENILHSFQGIDARLCIENIHSCHEPLKFIRRYGVNRCLDLEHLQIECAGVFEEIFVALMRESSHVHLTGYEYGSKSWHTHIHHNPEQGKYLLGLLKESGYAGFVVSEAKQALQTYEEFQKLRDFYDRWERGKDL